MSLKDKVVFITGASRGIGRAIALRCARDGAKVALAGRSDRPHPKLPGTLSEAAREVEALGGRACVCPMDVRSESSVEAAVAKAAGELGGIDALVNNAGALSLRGTERTSAARFDLLVQTNVRGAFLCTRACLRHLRRSANPHVLLIAPPISLEARWLSPHLPYTLSKYGMSLSVIGWSEEFRETGIAVNALWPATTIATSAMNLLGGEAAARTARMPQIVAEAAREILVRPSREHTGRFFIDEEVLREAGITDFSAYSVNPGVEPAKDLFIK